ncbi:uncharacterized protein EI97DRAFT_456495 [Westerdykella ornata]|uniref:Uncharacterized protein n=1 Tax=Westerdykella ornata TaxID=318751 RepID=A0A6A6JS52_WESOR|nr:uncharacterized protein EI97DRAFT_456495 [Westerdykella ornata]KAF2279094.1 hypothetical protein EI97DRAFT_456495 [Westerdykella ornata]
MYIGALNVENLHFYHPQAAESRKMVSNGQIKTLTEMRSLQTQRPDAVAIPPSTPESVANPRYTAPPQSLAPVATFSPGSMSSTPAYYTDTGDVEPSTASSFPSLSWHIYLNNCLQAAQSITKKHDFICKQLEPRSSELEIVITELKVQRTICQSQSEALRRLYTPRTALVDISQVEKLVKEAFNALQIVKKKYGGLSQLLLRVLGSITGSKKFKQSPKKNRKSYRSPKAANGIEMKEQYVVSLYKKIASATPYLRYFRGICSSLSNVQLSQQRKTLSAAEEQAFHRFSICRKVSAHLHEQLRRACPHHPEHRVYFNLQVSETLDQSIPELSFYLAFETTKLTRNDPGLVWFKAQSTLFASEAEKTPSVLRSSRSKSKSISYRGVVKNVGRSMAKRGFPISGSVPVENTRGSSCLGGEQACAIRVIGSTCLANLRQQTGHWAADLPDLMDKGTFTAGRNRLYYPEILYDAHSHPVSLSQWITEKRYVDVSSGSVVPTIILNLMRIKVARLLCEAVLRLTPTFWSQTTLNSEQLLIVDRISGGFLERVLEPHLSVRLDKWSQSKYSLPAQQVSPRGSETLLRIGIILLEIAHLRLVQGLRENEADEIDRTDPSFNLVTKLCGISLQKQFGRLDYAKAVDYCLNPPSLGLDISDVDFHKEFYQVVIVRLEKIERNLELALERQRRVTDCQYV